MLFFKKKFALQFINFNSNKNPSSDRELLLESEKYSRNYNNEKKCAEKNDCKKSFNEKYEKLNDANSQQREKEKKKEPQKKNPYETVYHHKGTK